MSMEHECLGVGRGSALTPCQASESLGRKFCLCTSLKTNQWEIPSQNYNLRGKLKIKAENIGLNCQSQDTAWHLPGRALAAAPLNGGCSPAEVMDVALLKQ